MRNILEATNTYKQRKTNSFSGKAVTNRHPLPCDYFNGNSSDPFSVAFLPSEKTTSAYFNMASGYKALDRRIFFISPEQVKSRLTHTVEYTSYMHALKTNTKKYYSNSGTLRTYCKTHQNINNIDCIITPESILKHEKESVNQVTACTLGEVTVMSDYLTQISLFQRADGIRPAIRSLN